MVAGRSVAVWVLVLTLVVSTQSLLAIQGAFVLNRTAIAEALCVNRDRPELKCEGLCQLKERLEQHERHDEDREAVLELALAGSSLLASPVRLVPPPAESAADPVAGPGTAWARGVGTDVFRPPRRA